MCSEIRDIVMPASWSRDVVELDHTIPHGIVVCGMSQAGKSTAKDIFTDTWRAYDPEAEVLAFTNSNGFRGLTHKVLERFDMPADREVDEDVFAGLLNEFVGEEDILPLLRELYHAPPPEEVLRSLAVSSVVAVTAETSSVRPVVNEAGAESVAKMLADPSRCGFKEAPSLVILDSRNHDEGRLKFERAGIKALGTIVLTCPEEVVVLRKPQSLDALKRRNYKDRNKPAELGPMTLPEDFVTTYVVDEMLGDAYALREAGTVVATDPGAAIVMRTDRLTIEQEVAAMEEIIHGMLVPESI